MVHTIVYCNYITLHRDHLEWPTVEDY